MSRLLTITQAAEHCGMKPSSSLGFTHHVHRVEWVLRLHII